jgi:hypothetical protein
MLRSWINNLLAESHRKRAIRQLRHLEYLLPSPSSRFAVPFVFKGKGLFRSICPKQSPREIEQAYQAVCDLKPRCVLELGTARGGSLYLWTQAATDDALIVSVDLPGGEFGGGYSQARVPLYESFARPGQTITLLRTDSQKPQTLEKVKAALKDQPADFAFIDADHRYEGVKKDYLLYSPLVRPGGLIGFHDIYHDRENVGIEVFHLWNQLKEHYPGQTQEILVPDKHDRFIGLGLLRVPDQGLRRDPQLR